MTCNTREENAAELAQEDAQKRKFIVSETYACWTTWTRTVEATSEAEALELFNDGEGTPVDGSPYLGDIIDYLETEYEVKVAA